jgi:D-serine deaminase-like pyridoxal phosphate-dependent protein
MLTSLVGLPVSYLDTPALLVDLDAFEANIKTMAADIKSRGADWRPHSKANKCPAIVRMQIEAGAIGVTCAKLGEAEVMAGAGIRDILIANQIVGPIKARRLAALAGQADPIVAVDNIENVRELDAAGRAHGTRPRVVIEVNTGMNRCGVDPGEAVLTLAQAISACEGLRFAGLMAWEGHAMAITDESERGSEVKRACALLAGEADALRAAGIPVDIVSAGGTGTYLTSAGVKGITEIEAGGGIWGDLLYRELGANVQPALKLLTQVTSRPTLTRLVVDSGRKTVDPSLYSPKLDGIEVTKPGSFSAEHGIFELATPSETPRIGDRLTFSIGYSDQCNHLHENFYGIRNGVIECIWPIAARGKIQ